MKLLFHCCCGPCAAACVDNFAAENIAPVLFWYNPNIHLFAEYQSRRDSLFTLANAKGLPITEIDEYGLRLFLRETGGETEVPGRCEICYRLRLKKTAAYAAENGFDAFSTSLLISPYQRHESIRRTGEEIAARYGIDFFYRDFRPLFREGQANARELGLYMQKYCGCIYSDEERHAKKNPVQKCSAIPITKVCPDVKLHTPESFPFSYFQRFALLTGEEALKNLSQTTVLIFGLGGVGSWCAEALARSGVGKIGLVDYDTVCESNINRQVQANSRTLGLSKSETLRQRLLEINPGCEVSAWREMFTRENAASFPIDKADYVIDAIDSLNHKLDLIEICCNAGVTLFSSMGMAQKMDPARIKTAGIDETHGCPLARLVRQGLRKRGFTGNFTAVYSDEQIPRHEEISYTDKDSGGIVKVINGSAVTVTAAAGMVLASLVLRDVMEKK